MEWHAIAIRVAGNVGMKCILKQKSHAFDVTPDRPGWAKPIYNYWPSWNLKDPWFISNKNITVWLKDTQTFTDAKIKSIILRIKKKNEELRDKHKKKKRDKL